MTNELQQARQALASKQYETCTTLCQQIVATDPDNWEANHLWVIATAMACDQASLLSAIRMVTDKVQSLYQLLKAQVTDTQALITAIDQMDRDIYNVSQECPKAFFTFYQSGSLAIQQKYSSYYWEVVFACDRLVKNSVEVVEALFGSDDAVMSVAGVAMWKRRLNATIYQINDIYSPKIHKYEPDYEFDPKLKKQMEEARKQQEAARLEQEKKAAKKKRGLFGKLFG